MSTATAKLLHGEPLSLDDRAEVDSLVVGARTVGARVDLISKGDDPQHVHVIVEGFACRYKLLPGGQRAIVGLFVPGDVCDVHVGLLGVMDHAIGTITECLVKRIPHQEIEALMVKRPPIRRALSWSTLVDEGILRQWLTVNGRLRSDERIAHLFCEIHARLTAVDRAGRDGFQLPLTQEDLADMLGMSAVHVNRVLQVLRSREIVTQQDRWLRFPDRERTVAFAQFDPDYLHMKPRAGGAA